MTRRLLRRAVPIAYIIAFAVASVLTARAWAKVESSDPLPPPAAVVPGPPPAPPPAARSKAGADLVARNMFCSTCEPAGDPQPGPAAKPRTPPPLSLIATHLGDESFATMRHDTTFRVGAYKVGDVVPGAGVIEAIAARHVLVRMGEGEDDVATISLEGAPIAGVETGPERATSSLGPPSPVDEGIRRIDETHFEIDRAILQKTIGNPAGIGGGVRPTAGGGLRLFGVRSSSPLAKIGLKNGDIIVSANGVTPRSPDGWLEVYTLLRSANNVSLGIVRRGSDTTLEYAIR